MRWPQDKRSKRRITMGEGRMGCGTGSNNVICSFVNSGKTSSIRQLLSCEFSVWRFQFGVESHRIITNDEIINIHQPTASLQPLFHVVNPPIQVPSSVCYTTRRRNRRNSIIERSYLSDDRRRQWFYRPWSDKINPRLLYFVEVGHCIK